ncbi:SMODS domain-containing nucleotidyltransferase [Hippea jasoniae]|uniref:SMODS domain-containing nucleotidyltransferase n=1 Tax=Hippea jasoniae TaxID=944479 RepID=UPI00054E0A98|nr:nucleotidyltransferase domain-containing protein [Hippea jasoniae]
MATINNLLKVLSEQLFISYNSSEREKIETSVKTIKKRLKSYFGNEIKEIELFGSYTRGTILPRRFDEGSDIDIMIIFSTGEEEYLPETYRNKLKRFAEYYYSNSEIYKDFPTVVLELNHIKFDLVPAIEKDYIFFSSLYIPNSQNEWIETNPKDLNNKLTEVNKNNNFIVKPLVRLFKFWNVNNGKVYSSFELETNIIEIAESWIFSKNYEDGFFSIIDKLPMWHLPDYKKSKVESLKNNAKWVKYYLERDNLEKAKQWLKKIIPFED